MQVTRTFTRVAALAAAFLLAAAATLVATPAAHAAITSITIDGTYIYSTLTTDTVEEVDGFSYNEATQTLTMTNVSISTTAYAAVYAACSTDEDEENTLNVVFKGTNTFTTDGSSTRAFTGTNFSFSGDTLKLSNFYTAISGQNLTFNSGTYSITSFSSEGMYASKSIVMDPSTRFTITATSTSNYRRAINTPGTVSNSYKSLVKVVGYLAEGVEFAQGGNVYEVTTYPEYAQLKKFGSKKKKVSVGYVTFGKVTYSVTSIGAKAFKNKRGAKVKELTITGTVRTIGKEACANMKSLKKLTFSSPTSPSFNLSAGVCTAIGKNAFKNCGKKKGKKLTVYCPWQAYTAAYKSALVKKGLSKKAKVVYKS